MIGLIILLLATISAFLVVLYAALVVASGMIGGDEDETSNDTGCSDVSGDVSANSR